MVSARSVAIRAITVPLVATTILTAVACVIQKPVVSQLDVRRPPAVVHSPIKAHLLDGSTVLYPRGVSLEGNTLMGNGLRYPIGSSAPMNAPRISLDSVVGMESYSKDVNVLGSVALSVASPLATALAAVALLGSCPTFYADSAGTELLQAEGFSYAIAPLFEQRDVDQLRLTPTADGRIVLNVRNEMMETHYINRLELIEIRHPRNEQVVPDGSGRAIAIGTNRLSASIHDRAGRNLSSVVRAVDNDVFSTIDSRLASVSPTDLDDYIDIAIGAPASADSVAIVLDMRNSLLNTVLLYDHILGAPGIKSLDFLGKDLENISNAVDMGRWYAGNMGMRVSVLDGDKYRRIIRIGDSGPIAYHRMAVLVPAVTAPDGLVHVRLSFVADDWRIDELSVADKWRRPSARNVPISRVVVSDPAQTTASLAALKEPDESYLITGPGQSFRVEFDIGNGDTQERTWFLASQGYYTEWVRGDWIRNASGKPFTPTNETLADAIRGWRTKQGSMEQRFYTQRISAR